VIARRGHVRISAEIERRSKAINELAAEAGKAKWFLGRAGTEYRLEWEAVGALAEKSSSRRPIALTEKQSSVMPRSARSRPAALEALTKGRPTQVHRGTGRQRILQS